MKRYFKEVNKLAIPILMTFMVEFIFGIADKAIIGRTVKEAFIGVGVVSTFMYVIIGSFGMLSTAFNILFAKNIDDKKENNKILNVSFSLSLILGILFEVFIFIFGKYFLNDFYHLSGNTLNYAYEYLRIVSFSFMLNLFIFNFSVFFRNKKDTKIFFYASTISLIVNFVIDYTLVFGKFGFPKMGTKGAAIGTIVGLVVGLLIYISSFKKYKYKLRFLLDKERLKEIVKLYIPLFLQDLIETTIFVLVITSFISDIGINEIGIYNLLDTIGSILMLIIYAYSGACLTLTTQEYSKKNYSSVKQIIKVGNLSALFILILIGIIYLLFPREILSVITNNKELIYLSIKYILFIIIIDILNIQVQIYKSCLQGINQEKWVLYFSLIVSLITLLIVYFISLIINCNLSVIYFVLIIENIVLEIGLNFRFKNCLKEK